MRNLEATCRSASGRPGGRSVAASARRAVAALSPSLALAAASWLVAVPASAQSEPEGNGVKIGETRLFPELRLDYFAYDNVYFESDEPVEASAVRLTPSVRWQADRRLVTLEASYVGRYSTGSEDILDFAEHELGLVGSVAPSSRVSTNGYARYVRFGEDLRLRAAETDEEARERIGVDVFELGGWIGYGASGARGNLRLGLDVDGYDPETEDGERFVLRRRQFTRVQPYARFSLRISPDTRWLLETRFSDVSRRSESGGVDDSRISLLTGLAFAASGAFGGELRGGVTRINYDSDFVPDDETFRLAAVLSYLPTTFSRFDLTLSRDFDPRFGSTGTDAGTAVTTAARLDWRYAYSERVGHRARLAIEDEDVDCPLAGNRQVDVGFELNLRVRRWIELGAGVDHEIDRLDDCGEEAIAVDPDLLETDATRIGAHVRLIL